MNQTCLTVFVAVVLPTISSGCLATPRNKQSLTGKTVPVQFTGLLPVNNMIVVPLIKNNKTGKFDQINHAPIFSGDAGLPPDGSGLRWFPFGVNDLTLPRDDAYWSAGNGRYNVAFIKAVASANEAPLVTFEADADACISRNANNGQTIREACRSPQSPVVELDAACGPKGQDCCMAGAACDSGNACHSGICEPPCGDRGQTCCAIAPACNESFLSCDAGKCACGGANEPCCVDNSKNKSCNGGFLCQSDSRCHACGGKEEPCCTGDRCNGLTCVRASPPRCTCGGLGEACCTGGGCSPGYQCRGQICARPDDPPPSCVVSGGACTSSPNCCAGELCVYGTCKPCFQHQHACQPGINELCCEWQDSCVLDQFSGQAQCNIPG